MGKDASKSSLNAVSSCSSCRTTTALMRTASTDHCHCHSRLARHRSRTTKTSTLSSYCVLGLWPARRAAARDMVVSLLTSTLLACTLLSPHMLVSAAHPSLHHPSHLPAAAPLVAASSLAANDLPCIYEGHVQTSRDWYGYLANVSVLLTGRMTFEFSYPADKCCLSVLFYLEDQMGVINARTNCWQKEAVLSAENDQILRLTPRFSWSGCHMDYPRGLPTYVCQGGRSFTAGPNGQSDRPTTWYLAVSNCATLMGIDLHYKLKVYGQLGECKSGHRYDPSSADTSEDGRPSSGIGNVGSSNPYGGRGGVGGRGGYDSKQGEVHRPDDGYRLSWDGTGEQNDNPVRVSKPELPSTGRLSSSSSYNVDESNPDQGKVCVIRGTLVTNQTWHGFIANISVGAGGGFRYNFAYPYDMQVQNVLLYADHDLARLKKTVANTKEACVYREHVIRHEDWLEKMLDLKFTATWNGCTSRNTSSRSAGGGGGGLEVYCQSERRFDAPKKVYIAVSNCYSSNGLHLDYRFEVSGFEGRMACSLAAGPCRPSFLSLVAPVAVSVLLVLLRCYQRGDDNVIREHLDLLLPCAGAVLTLLAALC